MTKGLGYVVCLAGVRVVNACFYETPLDVFLQQTVLMIVLAYVIVGLRRLYRRTSAVKKSTS